MYEMEKMAHFDRKVQSILQSTQVHIYDSLNSENDMYIMLTYVGHVASILVLIDSLSKTYFFILTVYNY